MPLICSAVATMLLAFGLGTGSSLVPTKDVAETRAIPPFHAVELAGTVDLVIRPRGPDGIRLSGPRDAVARVVTSVRDGKLIIEEHQDAKAHFSFKDLFEQRHPHVLCVVRAAALDTIKAAGACDLDASGLSGDRLLLEASGASHAKLQGKVRSVAFHLSGAGALNAERLEAEEALVDVSGACRVLVNARRHLKIIASGASEIRYLGAPHLDQEISGACVVRPK